MTIATYMTEIHRNCDKFFADAEQGVAKGNWEAALAAFRKFSSQTEQHFGVEEKVLFPELEEIIGEEGGPTAVMREEHEQMRQVLKDLQEALGGKDSSGYQGAAETLMIMLQQHNMKEEQVLYQMADQILADERERVLAELKSL